MKGQIQVFNGGAIWILASVSNSGRKPVNSLSRSNSGGGFISGIEMIGVTASAMKGVSSSEAQGVSCEADSIFTWVAPILCKRVLIAP